MTCRLDRKSILPKAGQEKHIAEGWTGKAYCRRLATNQGTDYTARSSRLGIATIPLRQTAAMKV